MRTHALIVFALAAFLGSAAHAQSARPIAPASAADGTQPAGESDDDVQAVHVVEKRPFTEGGRLELSLFAPIQVNTKFTAHIGMGLEVAYHIRENLAVQIGGLWNPIAQQSTLTEELVNKVNQQPLAADALLLQAGGLVGLELMPIYGKLNIFDGKILKLGFYLNVGLGLAKTELQLQSSSSPEGRTFGDTGIRPMAGLGAGFRVFLTDRFTLRLEIRDLVYSAYVSTVNGCNYSDTVAISHNGTGATVSSSCNISAFGSDPKGDAAVAAAQIQTPSADVVNNLTAYLGLSFLF